jgi:hypothetical protein
VGWHWHPRLYRTRGQWGSPYDITTCALTECRLEAGEGRNSFWNLLGMSDEGMLLIACVAASPVRPVPSMRFACWDNRVTV